MATGFVKSFNLSDGFGFITPDDGSADVRVELKAAEKSGLFTLLEGERISYKVADVQNSETPIASKLSVRPT